MNIIQVKSALCLISLLFITILLVSCGSEKSAQDKKAAAIDFKLKWPVAKSVGSIIPPIPPGVVTVRMSVSGPGVTTLALDFDVSLRTGSIPNVPVGKNRTITFQGLASNGDLIYQAVVPNVTLVPGPPYDCGTVAMSAVETPLVATAPIPPSGLSATVVSDTQIDLVWVDNSNDETGFRIERKTVPGGTYVQIAAAAPNDIKYNDTSLSAATAYDYQVVATNNTGDSVSNEVSATTASVAIPIVNTYSISGTITNGLAGVTITRSSNGSATTTTDSSGNYSFSGTSNGNYTLTPRMTGYTFTPADRTVNVSGADQPAMNFSAAAVATAPVAPSGLSASVISSTQVSLAWLDIANNETGYKIERSMTGPAGTYVPIATVATNVTVYNDSTGSANTLYHYRVLATNGVGDSGYSNVVNATTSPNTYRISGVITHGGVAFAGVSVALDGSATPATTNGNGNYSFIGALDGGSYTLTPSKAGYVFSPASQLVTVSGGDLAATTFVATAEAAPVAPSGLAATAVSASQINLTWVDNSNNEDGFSIERKIGSGGTYAQIGTVAADAAANPDTNLSSSTSYYYRVKASNEVGDSYSAEVIYTTAAVPTPPTGLIFTDPTTGMQLIKVIGGTYTMGDTFTTGASNESQPHSVTLSDFYIGKFEVTQGEWFAVMGTNPSGFSTCGASGANCPVEMVSWNDVQAFIAKLNVMSNTTYRLPTEAEWEYAAAVRTDGVKERYSGGSVVGDVAWYPANATGTTHPVGGKQANSRGIHDMSGNVWEWVNDWYEDTYTNTAQTNPVGPSSRYWGRVVRGGSWSDFVRTNLVPDGERTTRRGPLSVSEKYNYLGFRLAASP